MRRFLPLIFSILVSSSFAAETTVRFLSIRGEEAKHVFINPEGQLVYVPASKKEYDDLGLEGAGPAIPPQAELTWLYSMVRPTWETEDGGVEVDEPLENDCFIDDNGDALLFIGDKVKHNHVLLSRSVYHPEKTGPTTLYTTIEPPEYTSISNVDPDVKKVRQ